MVRVYLIINYLITLIHYKKYNSRLYLESGSWKFEGIGNGYKEGLELFIDKYAQ